MLHKSFINITLSVHNVTLLAHSNALPLYLNGIVHLLQKKRLFAHNMYGVRIAKTKFKYSDRTKSANPAST